MAKPINVKCPSCDQILAAADESGLVNVLHEHLYEEHALQRIALTLTHARHAYASG